MAENSVVLCEFKTATEAHLALERLQSEAINAFVSGAEAIPTSFSILGRMQYAPIRLHVAESEAQRANEILTALPKEKPPKGWEAEAEMAIEGWICQLCDTQVEESATVCPACGEQRPEPKKEKPRKK